jgi:Fe(3+) dicitrate transport protein
MKSLFALLLACVAAAQAPFTSIQVQSTDGSVIAKATVRYGNQSFETDKEGMARVPAASGDFRVVANGFQEFRGKLTGQSMTVRLEILNLAQQMTVSATQIAGSAEELARIPGAVEVVDKETLRDSRLFTFEEALRKVSGINTRPEEGFGLRPNIGIRGVNPTRSTRVLLLEDGLPLSYAPYGDNASYYHPMVDRFEAIEVVKGSGQILYGPMTVAGVVNYVTPAIPAKRSGAITITGGNRDYLNAHLRYGGTFGKTGVLVEGIRKQGEGSRDNTRSGLNDFTAKTLTTLSDKSTLSLKANLYTEDSRVTYSGLRLDEFLANPRQNPFRNDVFYGTRFGAAAQYTRVLTNSLVLNAAGYGAVFHRDWWRQSSNSAQRPNDSADPACAGMANLFTTCGNEGRLRSYTTWGIEPKFKTTRRMGILAEVDFGVRAHFELQDRQQANGPLPQSRTGVLVENNLRKNQAFSSFVQPRLQFGKWNITPGLRLEHIRYQRTNRLFNNGQGVRGETTLTKLIPGVGVAYSPTQSITLFGGAHRGFAPPRNEDIISNTGGFLDLDAELSWNYEVGMRYRASRQANFSMAFFRMDYQNQVVPASLAGGVGAVLTNGGKTLHQGIEFSGRYDWRNVFASSNSFYLSGNFTALPIARFEGARFSNVGGFGAVSVTGNRLPYAPKTLANATAGWYNTRGIHAFVEAVETGRQFGDDLNTVNSTADGQRGALPSYTLFNATLNVPFEAWKSNFFLTVKNLGDRIAIADRARGILPTHPRLFQVGVQYNF